MSEYKKVDSGGRYRNNIGGAISDKLEFQKKYKFAIAFENTTYDGYATEKLVEAFEAGVIPIYYGDPNISLDFNTHSFVNCHLYNNFDEVIDKVIEIDNDCEAYIEMKNQAPLKKEIEKNELENYLFQIFEQDIECAYQRPRSITSIEQEKLLLRHNFFEKEIYSNYKRLINQVWRIKTKTILSKSRKV